MTKAAFSSYYGQDSGGAAGLTPQVHPQETTVHSGFGPSYRAFLTSGSQKDVAFNRAVYASIDIRDNLKRRESYDSCRSVAWFVRHKVSGKVRIASSRCGLRWCPLCIKTKRFIMLQSIVPWLRGAKKPKFLTLTLKHSDAPLEFQIQSLYDFFKLLRRRPWVKKRIKGGIWFFQIKRSSGDSRWHPHLHMLVEGSFLQWAKLCQIWGEITHGSTVVDVRAVKNIKKAAEYVARYASAPCRLSDLSEEDAVQVVDALHGRRICGTWGSGKGIKLAPSKCPDADDWEFLDSFTVIMHRRRFCDFAAEVYRAFVSDDYCRAVPNPEPPPESAVNLMLDERPVKFRQLVFEWSNFYRKE